MVSAAAPPELAAFRRDRDSKTMSDLHGSQSSHQLRRWWVVYRIAAEMRRLLCRRFSAGLELDFHDFKHEELVTSMLLSAIVTSVLVVGLAIFYIGSTSELTGTLMPGVAATTTAVQAGLGGAMWLFWLLLRWERTQKAMRQHADHALFLLAIYASVSFPMMPSDRLLKTRYGSSWAEQMELLHVLHPDHFEGAECRAWLHPLLRVAANQTDGVGDHDDLGVGVGGIGDDGLPECFHGFPDHGTWKLLQVPRRAPRAPCCSPCTPAACLPHVCRMPAACLPPHAFCVPAACIPRDCLRRACCKPAACPPHVSRRMPPVASLLAFAALRPRPAQLWINFSFALFLRLSPTYLLVLAHACPAWWLLCGAKYGNVSSARGDGGVDSGSSVLLVYVQMLSLWYAAVRCARRGQNVRRRWRRRRLWRWWWRGGAWHADAHASPPQFARASALCDWQRGSSCLPPPRLHMRRLCCLGLPPHATTVRACMHAGTTSNFARRSRSIATRFDSPRRDAGRASCAGDYTPRARLPAATPPRRHAATPPRHHAATPPRHHPPTLPRRLGFALRSRGIRHDVFISHVWETGQDTSAVIKRLLAQLLPRARVFLDVDDLEDISHLQARALMHAHMRICIHACSPGATAAPHASHTRGCAALASQRSAAQRSAAPLRACHLHRRLHRLHPSSAPPAPRGAERGGRVGVGARFPLSWLLRLPQLHA